MIRIGPVSIALSVSVYFAMLLPSAAQTACSQWDLSGKWRRACRSARLRRWLARETHPPHPASQPSAARLRGRLADKTQPSHPTLKPSAAPP
jgi:hypothetical protein